MKESSAFNKHRSLGEKVFFAAIFVILIIYCASLVLMLVWMLYTSVKGPIEYTLDAFGLPKKFYWDNYSVALRMLNEVRIVTSKGVFVYSILELLYNSLFRSVVMPLITVFTTTCVAYVVSKYTFIGKNFIYALGLFVMITPITGNLPSAMQINKALGFYDNMYLWVLKGFGTPFGMNFILMYGAFKSIPWAYAESALIDGANDHGVMFRIMLPMMLPTATVIFVLSFLTAWNDYSTPLVWLPSYPNLAYGLYLFQKDAVTYQATVPQILAGFTVVAIPTSIIYIASQRLIVQRLTIGGLK